MTTLLPPADETLLLRAALAPDGADAAEQWSRQVPDAVSWLRARNHLSPILPILGETLEARALLAEPAQFRTVLRSARLREEERELVLRGILRSLLSRLQDEGLEPLVLRGVALAYTRYARPALRHAHDVELFLSPREVHRARRLLQRSGEWRLDADDDGVAHLRHASLLPLLLTSRLFDIPHHSLETIEPISVETAAGPMRVLKPEESLLTVLLGAFYSPGRARLRWVFDSVSLCADVDWERCRELCRRARAELCVAPLLSYLQGEFYVPVPDSWLSELQAGQQHHSGADVDFALWGPRRHLGPVRSLLGAGSTATRLLMLRRLVLPSPEFARWAWRRAVTPRLARWLAQRVDGLIFPPHLRDREIVRLAAAVCRGGEAGAEVWRRAPATAGERLRPQAYLSLRSLLPEPQAATLKLAYCQGMYRTSKIYREAERVLESLAAAGLPCLVLKGLAVAHRYYSDPYSRVMSDMDLLIRPADLPRAFRVLASCGWNPTWRMQHLGLWHGYDWTNASGEHLDLHLYLTHECTRAGDDDAVWERAQPFALGRARALALSPTDQLLHTCLHGMRHLGDPALWLTDAWHICATADIDWALLFDEARQRRLLCQLRVALRFLEQSVGLRPPADMQMLLRSLPIEPLDWLSYHGYAGSGWTGRAAAPLVMYLRNARGKKRFQGLWGWMRFWFSSRTAAPRLFKKIQRLRAWSRRWKPSRLARQ